MYKKQFIFVKKFSSSKEKEKKQAQRRQKISECSERNTFIYKPDKCVVEIVWKAEEEQELKNALMFVH